MTNNSRKKNHIVYKDMHKAIANIYKYIHTYIYEMKKIYELT